ncbi:hypothetical protein D3C75_571250 [compost metagenome]
MYPFIVYMLRSYTRSQRYFGPLAGIVIAVLILYSYKPNPVMNSYAATAVMLFISCAWMSLSFLNHEHAVHRQIAVVHMRSAAKHSAGGILTLAFLTLLLDLLIVLYPWVTGHFAESPGGYRLILALIGHGLLGMLGVAIALFFQSSWIQKGSHATGMLLAIVVLSLGGAQISESLPGIFHFLIWLLPPVTPVMEAMMKADTLSLAELLGSFAQALVYITLLIGFYLYRSRQRDYNKT